MSSRIIDQRTGVSIAVAITFGGALFLAGNYMGKVDALDRMHIPERLAVIQADLTTIKARLGIPINPMVVLDQISPSPKAIVQSQTRQPGVPRRAAILPE